MPRDRVTVNFALDEWIGELETFDLSEAEMVWAQVIDVFFANTQMAVHVATGRLKASGERSTERSAGARIIGEVRYTRSYAKYEFRRGGVHDALEIGFAQTEALFRPALEQAWEAMIRRW